MEYRVIQSKSLFSCFPMLQMYSINTFGVRTKMRECTKNDFIEEIKDLISNDRVIKYEFREPQSIYIKWFTRNYGYSEYEDTYTFREYDKEFLMRLEGLEDIFKERQRAKSMVDLHASVEEKEKYNQAAYTLLYEYMKTGKINSSKYDLASLVDYARANNEKITKPLSMFIPKRTKLEGYLRLVWNMGVSMLITFCITYLLGLGFISYIISAGIGLSVDSF